MKTPTNLSIQYPIKTILFFVVLTVILGRGISLLETKNSFDGELPSSDPINIDIEKVKEIYGDRSLVMVGLESEDLFTKEGINDLKSLTGSIQELSFIIKDEVKSLTTVENISKKSWGVESTGFMDELPTNDLEWIALRQDISDNQMVNGTLLSEDGKLATIIAPLEDNFDGGLIHKELSDLKSNYKGNSKIYITGAPILVEDVQQGIAKDSRKFIAIAIVFVLFGFFFCFRSAAGVFLPLIMVLISIVWTMGAMGFLGLNITVVSNALPVIMIAVASSYGIHFMSTYFDLIGSCNTRYELVSSTVDKIAVPIAITGLTSSLGSLSLLVFKVQSLKEFGIIGCLGFLFATIICLGLMPAMCMLIKNEKRNQTKKSIINKFTLFVTRSVLNNQSAVIGIYLFLIPMSIWYASKINIGDDYIKFFPKSHDGRKAAELFNDKLNGVRVMDLMVDSKEVDGIKNTSFYKSVSDFQEQIEKMQHVGGVNSYVDIVDYVTDGFDTESNSELWERENIAQYLMLHEMSATPGEVFTYYDDDYKTAHLQVLLKTSNPEDHVTLHQSIGQIATTVFDDKITLSFGGDVMHRIALGQYIVKGKIQNILLALLIVFLTTVLIFRSLKKGLLTIVPILISLLLVFGFMGLTGIRLGISTSLLTAMIVGIGIDFSIHYLVSFYKNLDQDVEESLIITSNSTSKAITFDAVSNILGFSVLSFSGFLPVQHFGWLLAFSMLLIFTNTLVVFPLMLVRMKKSRNVSIQKIKELKYKLT